MVKPKGLESLWKRVSKMWGRQRHREKDEERQRKLQRVGRKETGERRSLRKRRSEDKGRETERKTRGREQRRLRGGIKNGRS